jgi:hypothetical protein
MTSYIPEYVYGLIPGSYLEYGGPRYGLIPWPAHLQPRREEQPDIGLTKKGEAYVAAALAEADGVVFVTVDKKDRQSIATSIEKLINMLDDLEPDPDLEESADEENSLGWPERGPRADGCDSADRELDESDDEPSLASPNGSEHRSQVGWAAGSSSDCEEDCEDEGAQCDDEGVSWAL